MSTKMEQLSGGASLTPPPQSPSFNTFSSENIADVAARVVKELNLSHDDPFDDDFYSAFDENFNINLNHQEQEEDDHQNNEKSSENGDDADDKNDKDDDDEESEFEFAILNREENISPISADEIFANGQIRPIYPIFNTDLVYGRSNGGDSSSKAPETTIRVPLRKFFEEREGGGASCSSSEAEDELEGVPPGTYCVWTPKKKEEIMMRKKSKSTSTTNGSSRRWRFMNLLHRSNSDGKDTFVFLTPSNTNQDHQKVATSTIQGNNDNGMKKKKKMMMRKGDEKRKSYLPYRQDLVGFFANVNGISRTVRPF